MVGHEGTLETSSSLLVPQGSTLVPFHSSALKKRVDRPDLDEVHGFQTPGCIPMVHLKLTPLRFARNLGQESRPPTTSDKHERSSTCASCRRPGSNRRPDVTGATSSTSVHPKEVGKRGSHLVVSLLRS